MITIPTEPSSSRRYPAATNEAELNDLAVAILANIPMQVNGDEIDDLDDGLPFAGRTGLGTRGAYSEAAQFHFKWRGRVWRLSLEEIRQFHC